MSGELRSAQPHAPWEASVILSGGQGRVASPRIFAGGAGVSADSEDVGYSLHFMSILHLKGINLISFLSWTETRPFPLTFSVLSGLRAAGGREG